MFEHADAENVQVQTACFAFALSLALEHPSNYSIGAQLTQVAAQPATEPRAALAYPSWQSHPTRATHGPPLSATTCHFWILTTWWHRGAQASQHGARPAFL